MKEISTHQPQFNWSHQLQEKESLWTMWQISHSKKLFLWWNLECMRRESIDQLVCLLLLVCIQPTCTFTEVKYMIGAAAVTPKLVQCAMDNASGSSQDLGLWHSMSQRVVTIKCAMIKCVPVLLSVMVLISTYLNGFIRIIEVSGVSMLFVLGGDASDIGCSLSTSDLRCKSKSIGRSSSASIHPLI